MSDKECKTLVLHVRVSKDDMDKLHRLSAESGMPISWLIRNMIDSVDSVQGPSFFGSFLIPSAEPRVSQ